MSITLIFATHNPGKVKEVKSLIPEPFEILSLKDAGIEISIPEPFHTLKENASAKSRTIFEKTGKNCFSEDTGLEVEALGGEPGVHTAHYAGEQATADENMHKLLTKLQGQTNRKARFRTVISLILEGKEYFFEGVCDGQIAFEKRGTEGFGYDPVFIPDGAGKTFAEMNLEEKNQCSHRKKAILKLIEFLKSVYCA
ncbi:MAG: RdgB/HAM1 family non-canonical purine NTP pyrophosphatase [Chitinophagaceae bacterium]|nr:RdgB/HAM1 family non-canonical purine NTP pyrophosphatase [Chitinophagaceae bacterium]